MFVIAKAFISAARPNQLSLVIFDHLFAATVAATIAATVSAAVTILLLNLLVPRVIM